MTVVADRRPYRVTICSATRGTTVHTIVSDSAQGARSAVSVLARLDGHVKGERRTVTVEEEA